LLSLESSVRITNHLLVNQFDSKNDLHFFFAEPLELVLKSTDNEGLFHCNARVNLQDQKQRLTASIENVNINPPKFNFNVEQINETTIRIRIKPNGYVGVNRISCHWNNNLTFGHTVDLIVGGIGEVIKSFISCNQMIYCMKISFVLYA